MPERNQRFQIEQLFRSVSHRFPLTSSRRGSGLIQVVIVAGITAILSLGIASLLTSSMRGQRAIEVRDAVRIMETELLSHLSDSTACTRTLVGLSPLNLGVSVTQIKRADNTVLFTVGDIVQNNMVRLAAMQFRGFVPHDAAAPTLGRAILSVRFEPLGDPVGPKEFVRELAISAQLNGSNQLVSCTATGSSGSQLWLASPSVIDGIYTASRFVGIGRNDPVSVLDVVSNGNATNMLGDIRNSNFAPGLQLIDLTTSPAAAPDYRIGWNSNRLSFTRDTNSDGSFEVEDMTLRNGNLGIGTASPTAKLEVTGQGLFSLPGGDPGIYINKGDASVPRTYWGILNTAVGSESANRLTFGVNSTNSYVDFTERMVITNSGNVGIGTTNPSGNLHITGAGAGQIATLRLEDPHTNAGGFPQILLRDRGPASADNEIWSLRVIDSGNFGLGVLDNAEVNYFERFAVTRSGNVGINTPNPLATLHIASSPSNPGVLRVDSGHLVAGSSNGSFVINLGNLGSGASASGFYVRTLNNSNDIDAYTDVFMVNRFAQVGINTNTPSYNLDVNGTIRGFGITDSSDLRLKTDVADLDLADAQKIFSLRPVRFSWLKDLKKDTDRQIGFIAQDLEAIFPELVETDQQGIKSVNYSHLTAPLVAGLQLLRSALQDLRALITEIREEVQQSLTALRSGLTELRAALTDLRIMSEGAERRILQLESENADLKARLLRLEERIDASRASAQNESPGSRVQR